MLQRGRLILVRLLEANLNVTVKTQISVNHSSCQKGLSRKKAAPFS